MSGLSRTQIRALIRAMKRPGGFLCPMPHSSMIEQSVLRALRRRGFATFDPCPRITLAGLHAIASWSYESEGFT